MKQRKTKAHNSLTHVIKEVLYRCAANVCVQSRRFAIAVFRWRNRQKDHLLNQTTFLWALAAVVSVTGIAPALSNELRIVGSRTASAAVFDDHKEELEETTGISLRIRLGGGTKQGLRALQDGYADLAALYGNIDDLKSENREVGNLDIGNYDDLREFRVGTATVAFITRADNSVASLSQSQIKDLLTGRITNWSAVGGADLPVTVIAVGDNPEIRFYSRDRLMVERRIVGGPIPAYIHISGGWRRGLKSFSGFEDVVAAVEKTPGGLGIVERSAANSRVRVIPTDFAITIPLVFATKGEPTDDARKLIDATQRLGLR